MRHRSLTNSRPLEDRALRDHYRDQFSECEIGRWLRKHGIDVDDYGCEVHHIFSIGRRPDLWSNLITLSRDSHRWVHNNPVDGRIVALWVKATKLELDLEEFRTASAKHLEGYLAMVRPTLEVARLPYEVLTEKFG